jgi:tRNA A-37 threonylcarbamoyl transferase component Bud32
MALPPDPSVPPSDPDALRNQDKGRSPEPKKTSTRPPSVFDISLPPSDTDVLGHLDAPTPTPDAKRLPSRPLSHTDLSIPPSDPDVLRPRADGSGTHEVTPTSSDQSVVDMNLPPSGGTGGTSSNLGRSGVPLSDPTERAFDPGMSVAPSDSNVMPAMLPRPASGPGGAPPARPVSAPGGMVLPGGRPMSRPQSIPDPTKEAQLRQVRGVTAHLEDYDILEEIGRGGMGVVYKARHKTLKRVVALKMILSGNRASGNEVNRFRLEAEAAARLQHANIIQIYEVGEQDGFPYLALEYAEGGSLEKQIAGNPWEPRPAAGLIRDVASAMHEAHTKQVIHRDLKPANILLAGDGTPKVTDFGLAKALDSDSQLSRSNQVVGTPSYMAPEQAAGESALVGPHSDVWALGAILYELLTGRPPFRGSTMYETIVQVGTIEPVAPTRLNPAVPRDLETICLKCLRKEPHKRYATARALADDLGRFLAGELIKARPPRPVERVVKWVRRKPSQAALACLGILFVGTLGTGGVAYTRSLEERRALQDRSERERLEARAAKVALEAKEARLEQDRIRADAQRRQEAAEKKALTAAVQAKIEQQLKAAGELAAAATRTATKKDWTTAKEQWDKALAEADAARAALDVSELKGDDELRAKVQAARDKFMMGRRDVDRRTAAIERLAQLQKHRDEAVFHATQGTGEGEAKNLEATRAVLAKAIDTAGMRLGTGTGVADLDPEDAKAMAPVLYETLLIGAWAEMNGPTGGATVDAARRDAAAKLLARAGDLGKEYGLPLTTQESLTARLNGRTPPPAAAEATLLDKFLKAFELYTAKDTPDAGAKGRNKYEEAQRACEEVLARQPGHFWARYIQGLCQVRDRKWAAAQATMTLCAESRPDFVWPLLVRGFAASEQGFATRSGVELDNAAKDFERVLQKEKQGPAAYVAKVSLGVLAIRKAGLAEKADDRRATYNTAVTNLEDARRLKADDFQANKNLAHVYRLRAKDAMSLQDKQRDLNRAADALGRATEALKAQAASPADEASLLQSRAQVNLELGKNDKAIEDLKRVVDLAAGNKTPTPAEKRQTAENYLELARLLSRGDKPDYAEALADIDRALALVPDARRNAASLCAAAAQLKASTLLQLKQRSKGAAGVRAGVEAGQALDEYLAVTASPKAEDYKTRALLYLEDPLDDKDETPKEEQKRLKLSQAIDALTLGLSALPADKHKEKGGLGDQLRAYRGYAYLAYGADKPALTDFEAVTDPEEKTGRPTRAADADVMAGRAFALVRLGRLIDGTDEAARVTALVRKAILASAEAGGKPALTTARPVTAERLLYLTATTYAQAAGAARRQQREAMLNVGGPLLSSSVADPRDPRLDPRGWEAQAVSLLRQALERMPASARPEFWNDSALEPVRNTAAFRDLEAKYRR